MMSASGLFEEEPMDHATADISSQRQLEQPPPGSTMPPSKRRTDVTIVKQFPKLTRIHLKANVDNGSGLRAPNVYVDGSFISKSRIPSVSPMERVWLCAWCQSRPYHVPAHSE
ncbi:hypothetical protein E1B28_000128 [Marasmius oreades]|uniref:Uncharacterized protein n=1 Tax=Marasmius oreades TaxID=181124 RepID=A0A9P8AE08_9AGAR|nr:uncharacterized protein E1B28_000128 [Marasmius oreades]KAG7098159.1 hypothetical protein E1B28_000128 [Marasmius oreades]